MFRHRFPIAGSLLIFFAFVTAPVYAQLQVDGEAVRLTTGEQTFLAPKWSPDGSRLAVSGDGYTGIYVIELEGGEIRTVTEETGAGYGFAWAPDGEAVLSRVARFEGPRRTDAIKIFDVDTGTAEQLTEFRSDMSALPRWDDSGDRVFLYANDRLEVFPPENGGASKASDRIEWVAAEQGLASVSLSSKEVRRSRLLEEQTILNVTPSQDGMHVAFEVLGGNLFVTRSDGTGLVDLGTGNRPSWSPDGQWIVYMRTEDDGHNFTESDLYAATADGSVSTRLTDTAGRLEMNPAWSPDGTRIAFDDFADGTIYLLPVSR